MGGRGLIFSLLIAMTVLGAHSTAKSTYSKKDALNKVAEKKSNHLRSNKERTVGDIESDSDNDSINDSDNNSKNDADNNTKNSSDNNSKSASDNNSKSNSDNNSNNAIGKTSDSDEQVPESDEIDRGSAASNHEDEDDLDNSKKYYNESDENDSSDNDAESENPRFQLKNEKRSVMAGDTFSPSEMLPIAKKLISKVESPGEGKGIVSSAKNSQELADRLFEAFFLTHKRIVMLKDFDISGLDALQALALSGGPANVRTAPESVTAPPKYRVLNFEGQYVGVDTKPRQCHYRLITKKDNIGRRKPNHNKRRRVIDLASRLAKKRRLVVKGGLKDEKIKTAKKLQKDIGIKANKHIKIRSKQKPNIVHLKRSNTKALRRNQNKINAGSYKDIKNNDIVSTSTPACRWQYKCEDMTNLDTCRLHTKCNREVNKPATNLVIGDNRNDEYTLALQRFRKMLRLSDVDEEVEKILENRILNLRPPHLKGVEKIETLTEYFNKIIISEFKRTTTPLPHSIVELLTKANTGVPQEMIAKTDENEADGENKERKRRRLSDTRTTPLAPKHSKIN